MTVDFSPLQAALATLLMPGCRVAEAGEAAPAQFNGGLNQLPSAVARRLHRPAAGIPFRPPGRRGGRGAGLRVLRRR